MENTNKITKREKYEAIINVFKTGETAIDPEILIAFCEDEIASLEKKAAKAKETAAAKKAAPDALVATIESALTGEFQTVAEILAVVNETDAEATAQKVVYRLGKMVEAGSVERTEVSVPATETSKARKVKAFRALNAD